MVEMVVRWISKIQIPTNTPSNKEELDRLLDDITQDLEQQIKWGLTEDDINFTGDTYDSIRHEDTSTGKYIVIDTPYAGFLEYGLPSGSSTGNININIDQLRSWVFHKLGITDEEENKEVTFKIAKKIQNKGIRPKRFIKKAIKRMISGRSVPPTPRARRAKTGSGFFTKLRKKLKKLKILKKLKSTNKKVKRLLNKAEDHRRKIKRYGK